MRFNNLPEDTSLTGTEIVPSTDTDGNDKKIILNKFATWLISSFKSTIGGASQTIKAAIDAIQNNKVSNAGDTMTGNLRISKSSPLISLNDTTVDLEQSNNDVTTTVYQGSGGNDKNDYAIGRFYSFVNQSGDSGTGMWAYNRNSAGTQVGSGSLIVKVNKSGVTSYNVSNPAAFRTAIGVDAVASNASWNNSISVSNIVCMGRITGGAKDLFFQIPYNYVGGTATLKSLSIIMCGGQTAGADYMRVRSGTNGATYTQLGSGLVSMIDNGAAVRSNEISSVRCTGIVRSGFNIGLFFVYPICRDDSGTSAYNNTPVSIFATATITLS